MYLYIHIPFCESKCKYCRFASLWKFQKIQIEKYVDFILTSPLTPLLQGEGELKSIYFGWWTPGVLSLDQLDSIISKILTSPPTPLLWGGEGSIEITLETTPNKITKENLTWWKKIWINRLSIWVQSLNNDTLKEIWRGNKWDVIWALDEIRDHPPAPSLVRRGSKKINNISLDFIIWLPHVKKWGVKKDIEFILDNYDFVKHISVYMLEELCYPWNWEDMSINQDDYLWEYLWIVEFLESRGFHRYEISNFAKPWYECEHNKAYWNHSEVKAIWLWASWYEDRKRYSFSEKMSDFYAWKNIQEEELTSEDIFIEKVMFWLRTSGLDEEIFKKLDKEKIEEFVNQGYLIKQNKKLKLLGKWVLVLDFIMSEII